MLLELRVENYAVIDNVAVEFAPGLNLLTGETGAGKSILIDALALLLGDKASADAVRHGTEKAWCRQCLKQSRLRWTKCWRQTASTQVKRNSSCGERFLREVRGASSLTTSQRQ